MNVQFKKGVLELCALVLTSKRDRYGYELAQAVANNISFAEGSIYPLLRRLTQEGHFSTYLEESQEGPPRKYYHLTDKGRTYMLDLVAEWNQFSSGVAEILKEV